MTEYEIGLRRGAREQRIYGVANEIMFDLIGRNTISDRLDTSHPLERVTTATPSKYSSKESHQ